MLFHYCCQDEIHERDRFSDFLLIAMRDLLTVNRRLKLILMSAALDINLFIEYFGKCPVVHGNVSKCTAEFIICLFYRMLKLSWIPDCQSTQHAKKLVSNSPGLGGSG